MRRLLTAILAIAVGSLGCQAECNACAAGSGVACISERQFQFCANNQTTGPVNSCPADSYCSSQVPICQKNAALVACAGCGECNELGTFACTGTRTFALCLGSNRPSNITASCSDQLVCNRNLPEICGNATATSATCPEQPATTEQPSTEDDTDTTTLESTTVSTTDDFCRASFKGIPIHAIPNDTECTSYIYCRFYIQSWVGRIIDCPSDKPYFNGWTLCCGTTKSTLPGCLVA
ncbi:uncharacterized protein LOC135430557 [Drosophila montana]|uniref:uncharacterized protein LOC135430557 n=1 Tax=Drosophila montana TaxID=40370 RepID=UPI00313BEA27